MVRHTLFCVVVISTMITAMLGCRPSDSSSYNTPAKEIAVPTRIVSTSPSLTDTAIAIGLGDRLVGVSSFCNLPAELDSTAIARVGGLFDHNRETVLALKPDCVLVLQEDIQRITFYQKLGISVITVNQNNVNLDELLQSYEELAASFDDDTRHLAQQLAESQRQQLAAIREKNSTAGRPPVRVLLCFDRETASGKLQSVYVAGNNRLYNDAIRVAGGKNVLEDTTVAVPQLSMEKMIRLNPEVILDLSQTISRSDVTAMVPTGSTFSSTSLSFCPVSSAVEVWRPLGNEVEAVRTGRVYSLPANYATVPGPSFLLFVEQLSEILHSAP